jgi:hypothetical protein
MSAALAAGLALLLPPLGAQTVQTGVLEGRVTLPDGRVIANVRVEIRQADGSFPRTTRTDELGAFRLGFIPPGTYDATLRQVGFQPVTVTGIVIRAAELQRISATLEPVRRAAGGERPPGDSSPSATPAPLEPVRVTADNAAGRATTPELTFSLSARERALLPTPRDANGLIAFTPGARPGQVYGGSTNQANLYQLDGVTVNQPGLGGAFLLPNVDWIEEFKVIGPGAGAEYGNFQGGLVNIVTKSGSNTLRGQLRTFVENRALSRQNLNAFEAGSELDSRVEVNGELRGPLVRDRLYFFLSGQQASSARRVVDARITEPAAVTFLPSQTERLERTAYGKLTWLASESDIVNFSLGLDDLRRERVALSAFTAPDATARGRSPSLFYQASLQRTVGPRAFFELKFSGYAGRDDELPYNGADFPSVALLDAPNTPRFANAAYSRRNTPSSHGVNGTWDAHLGTRRVRHHLKFGGEFTMGSWREERTRNGGLSWYTEAGDGFDPLDPRTWREIPSLGVYATADTGGRIDLDAGTVNSALFLQDDIRLGDRLTLSAGVRFGQWSGSITPGNGGGIRGRDRLQAVSARGWDPRLGATFDVLGDGRLVTRAHWGRYHQNLFALFFDRAPGSNVFTNIAYCDWNDRDGTVLPELGRAYTPTEFGQRFTCFPGANLVNEVRQIEEYRQPYMDQLTLGVTRALGRRLTAEVVYLQRRNGAVLSLVDKRVDRNWSPLADVRVADANGPVRDVNGKPLVLPLVYVRNDDLVERLRAGDVIPGYVRPDTLRLAFEQELVLRPVDEARRSFQQVQVTVSGAWPRLSFAGTLAWTRLTGNVFSVNGYFDPSGQGSGPFVEPNARLNFDGRLTNYAPWDARLRVTGQLPWGLEGGAFLTVVTGDFWTPTLGITRQQTFEVGAAGGGSVPLDSRLFRNAVGQAVFTEARGSRQYDALANLDVRLQKVLRLGRHDLIVGAEAFNLLNGAAVIERKVTLDAQDPAVPSSLAGAPRLRQAPTTVRLNVQWRL